ncbi:putative Glycosyl transferase, group 4; Putative undecaprenyl-phosphate N-acetylglucosaminyl 1-phosphate transferase [Bradyrhizobium sp. ORS 278]|uniref:glycosyl transferase n=1 Tax=Bradyrhizobium sp. (strain ORS 278) TaxID=114615 RepID=UPI00015089C8|nr:glycosyl transferase [Bradyrhizobium sp. ORS 278]CAL78889.1 putative Glycosyl transferase, group 4; Putative undecaprenyl-phosphate N-acetylglucosaminyl 1-phosphate transferase [Bradyrhizobium sp. ORS 278]
MIASPAANAALIALLAAVMCAVSIVLLRPLLQRYALARPNARSSHKIPTPQGAGIAVVGATLVVGGAFASVLGFAPLSMLFIAVPMLALVGLVDDIRPIPVLPRFVLQGLAVGLVVFTAPDDLRLFQIPLAVERTLLLIAGLWFVNLVNFMDGLDLMTVAEAAPITTTLVLFGLSGGLPWPATAISAALAGAMLGFAPFNKPVANVFLGDVGSLPIGLLLGWGLLHLAWQGSIAAALLLPLYYLVDATFTLLRRMARREPFWAAHRTHFYQQATDNGFTVARVVGEVFVLNIALAALAVLSVALQSLVADVILLVFGLGAVAFVLSRFSRPRR